MVFEPNVLKVMQEDAQQRFPLECVGFLFGSQKTGETVVVKAQPTSNVHPDDQRRRFAIDPLAYMRAEKQALKEDLVLVGIYHSHPNYVAIPSIHDHEQALPGWSYPIVSVHENGVDHIRSWRLNSEDLFQEETIIERGKK
ncbi:MAG: M67 family metallopeptidase [Bacteroidota bacterium]